MKFLITVTPMRGAPFPPQMVAGLLTAQRQWLRDRVADGTLECVHGFVTGGGIGVATVDSHEEINALLLNSPGFPISEFEVTALADADTVIGNAVTALERIGAAMPGG